MENVVMPEPLHLVLIYGSTREGRFCDTVATWAAARVGEHPGFTLDVVDPAELTLIPHRHEAEDCDEVRALQRLSLIHISEPTRPY